MAGGNSGPTRTPRAPMGPTEDLRAHMGPTNRPSKFGAPTPLRRACLPVPPERNPRLTAESLAVLPQCGDLKRRIVDHKRDGAVLDAARHYLQSTRGRAAHHLVRQCRRCDVATSARTRTDVALRIGKVGPL
jgi:hypothetical protein